MVAKPRSRYVCQSCGHVSPRWLGRCPGCEEWDTFVEEAESAPERPRRRRQVAAAAAHSLSDLRDEPTGRSPTGLELLDRVLGGGLVAGSAILLAGEPGIGKSTLLLAMAESLARRGVRVLYVTAEESRRQLRLRAERLGCASEGLLVAAETRLEPVLAAVDEHAPQVLLVDSIQAVRSLDLEGMPGSIGQVRACADRLVEIAKERDVALFLVGHVTKEGGIAGPKSLEHLVDAVLSFEGERTLGHRLLRASKNRFGSTGEVALFEMRERGLEPVPDPSRVLLARRQEGAPGSAVAASLQGTRPLLVEIQALVHRSGLPTPRRTTLGLDGSRPALLLAVLERFGRCSFADRDVFLNVVGGIALREPATDLPVAAALLSALREKPLPDRAAWFGEVGLLGEVRPVSFPEVRLREIAALGLRRAYCPPLEGARIPPELEVTEVGHVSALSHLLGLAPRGG
jgi:DNA repair protein RadA/Sms